MRACVVLRACSRLHDSFLCLCATAKTSSLLFNYLLSTCLGLQPFRAGLAVTVAAIFTGTVLASFKATHFSTLGFLAVVVAGFMAAARWVITERYFVSTAGSSHSSMSSLNLLFLISPVR